MSLVLGGARSGKSAFAEKIVLSKGLQPVYLASAEAWDEEMRQKIAAHRAAREGAGWLTIEAPLAPAEAIAARARDEAVLFDCTTMWLSNLMMAGRDLVAETAHFLDVLDKSRAHMVIVSNEVGQGIVPDNPAARAFRDAQGRLNQALAERAANVVAVIAGLPLVLKGKGL